MGAITTDGAKARMDQKDKLRTGPLLPPAKVFTVLIADDHPVVRDGLTTLLNRRPDIRVIGQAGNGCQAVEQYLAKRPDVMLLDLRMPVMDGLEALAAITAKAPEARVVMLTSYENEEDIYQALHSGAQGYLLKDAPIDQLAECVRVVASGKRWIPPEVGAKLARRVATRDLTAREMQVLRAIAAGKSNKEIGVALNITEATVKVHVTHVLEKLKVSGRTEAIGVALKRGLVHMGF